MTRVKLINPFIEKFAKCTECPLNGGRCLTAAPPATKQDVIVISQQPLMADVLADDAFDSRGGRLVKRLLEHIGISEDKWTGTYSVLCVPEDKVPASAATACRDRLIAQVKYVRPKVIIAMGEIAIGSIFRSRAHVTPTRGMPFWDAELDAYILPTHHPRFAMEQPSAFSEVADDFTKVPKILKWEKGKQIERPKTKHHTITDEDKAIQAIEYVRQNASWVSGDVETQGFNWKTDKIIAFGFSWKLGTTIIFDKNIVHSAKVQPYLKQFLEDRKLCWIWHNGKFDVKFFRWQHGIHARVDFDTLLGHYVLNERRGTHDLEQVAIEFIYAEPWEHKIEPYKKRPGFQTYEDIPKPVLHTYLGKDVDYTGRVYIEECERLEEERLHGRNVDFLLNEILLPAVDRFVEIEMNGIYIDETYKDELEEYFVPLIEEHTRTLQEYADGIGWNPIAYAEWWTSYAMLQYRRQKGNKKKPPNPTKAPKPTDKTFDHTFNPNSHQQLKFVMYQLLKLPLYKGDMTSNKEARKWYLENCNMPVPFVERLDKLKKDSKAYTTYVKGLNDVLWDDHCLHPSFNLQGTETGRLSSSEPNVQNIPRDSRIKNLMIAEPEDEYVEEFGEWIMLQADYSQAELRVLAVLGGSPWLQGVYYRGEDLHNAMSLQLYGPNFTKDQRVRAKAVNFGIPYGRSEYTLADEHKMRISEARKLIKDWFLPQPETKAFMDARREEPLKGIVYTSPTGRQRNYGLITEHNKRAIMNEAGNMPIQGTAADLTTRSVVEIVPAIKDFDHHFDNGLVMPMAKVVNTVHDSIILQVRANYLPQVTEVVHNIMTTVPGKILKTDMPFVADFEVGYRWGDLKGYDLETNLVSWEVKQEDGSKLEFCCPLEPYRASRGDVKAIMSQGLAITV